VSAQRSEFYFKGYQDLRLYAQLWPFPNAKGTLIITHGQGEHGECYHRVVEALKHLPIQIVTWDLRGHGRSEGLRGVVDSFDEYCQDFRVLLQHLMENFNLDQQKIFLLGHSMGALIQTRSLLQYSDLPKIDLQILSGPLFRLSKQVPALKQFGSIAMKLFAPKLTTWNEIRNEDCSRDPAVIQEYLTDIYRHGRISAGAFLGFYESWRLIFKRASEIKSPTLVQLSDRDPVISSASAQDFFKLLKCQKELKIYRGRSHEIYNDLGREEVFKDLSSFLGKAII
jgi:lysophospholipase